MQRLLYTRYRNILRKKPNYLFYMVPLEKLHKTVKKQRKALKRLLSESISDVATACAKKMHDRHAVEDILSSAMNTAEYCKYLWVLDKSALQLTDDVKSAPVSNIDRSGVIA